MMISCFQAVRQARAPVAGLEPASGRLSLSQSRFVLHCATNVSFQGMSSDGNSRALALHARDNRSNTNLKDGSSSSFLCPASKSKRVRKAKPSCLANVMPVGQKKK
ncbi:hypothetical protein PoB_004632300 [Plakobranchus ocellatus]|uniref:Uncharacterized protein n=1 Tax=Plakobranchus ocellatus TaxID=259542 RepID=A0AAV4BKZ2_9GAST|nr:hypothetical protein PoB_004632300 [Plakobranchus ocellatus]